jgi:hypothetical protein
LKPWSLLGPARRGNKAHAGMPTRHDLTKMGGREVRVLLSASAPPSPSALLPLIALPDGRLAADSMVDWTPLGGGYDALQWIRRPPHGKA